MSGGVSFPLLSLGFSPSIKKKKKSYAVELCRHEVLGDKVKNKKS